MTEERRKAVRIKKFLTVRYSLGAEKKWDITTIKDISETGVCIITQKQFSPSDVMALFVKIPTRPLDWIEFTAKVVASEGAKGASGEILKGSNITRLEFIDLKDEQKEAIRQYIAWFLTKEGGGQK